MVEYGILIIENKIYKRCLKMLEYKLKERDNKILESLKNITVERGATPSEALVARDKIEKLLNKQKEETKITEIKNQSLSIHKEKVSNETKVNTQLQTEVKTKTVTVTKNHLICPVCGNDKFYGGACGGLAQNILCDNCFTEFNHLVIDLIQYGIPDLKRLKEAYGIRPIDVKRKNLNSYNEMINKSSLFQRIFYN
jgi:hypothetical protein